MNIGARHYWHCQEMLVTKMAKTDTFNLSSKKFVSNLRHQLGHQLGHQRSFDFQLRQRNFNFYLDWGQKLNKKSVIILFNLTQYSTIENSTFRISRILPSYVNGVFTTTFFYFIFSISLTQIFFPMTKIEDFGDFFGSKKVTTWSFFSLTKYLWFPMMYGIVYIYFRLKPSYYNPPSYCL